MKRQNQDPRAPTQDPTKKDKPIDAPDQSPRQPGFDDDKRHPHQEGPMPSG